MKTRVLYVGGLGRRRTTLIECALGEVVHLRQIVARPEAGGRAEMTRPVAFLDDSGIDLGQCHSAAGNPMRLRTGRVELRPDNAWRSSMPRRQRATVEAVCAPLLRSYGYGLTT